MGPKSFSAVIVRKTTAQCDRRIKSNASVVLKGGFFQVVDWKTHRNVNTSSGLKKRYFKFVISPSDCQQLGLYSQCYTVCDFTLH